MQWLTVEDHKRKTKTEGKSCRKPRTRAIMKPSGHPDADWRTAPKLTCWFCVLNVAAFTSLWFSEPAPANTKCLAGSSIAHIIGDIQ